MDLHSGGSDLDALFPQSADGSRRSLYQILPSAKYPKAILAGNRYTNNHFNFLISDGIPRIILADTCLNRTDTPIIFGPLRSVHLEILSLLWTERKIIQVADAQTVEVGELVIPHPATYSPLVRGTEYATYDWEILMNLKGKLPLHGDPSVRANDRVIYLSRSMLHMDAGAAAPGRVVANEDEVCAAVLRAGGEVVYPEQLSLIQQMEMLATAKVIVAQGDPHSPT